MWEWTRSAYRPNPYQDDGRNQVDGAPPDLQRVVRGGSWYDRPFRRTSSFRLPCRQYQGVYNVGFRVVVEEQPPTVPDYSESENLASRMSRSRPVGCVSGT